VGQEAGQKGAGDLNYMMSLLWLSAINKLRFVLSALREASESIAGSEVFMRGIVVADQVDMFSWGMVWSIRRRNFSHS
jgi:hypothetical protein